ncbi:Molybdopterin-guanine dinucleotide biosynthesis protein [[Clostridium] ultunense Esp]|uniref:Molybdopterin-guanine dinucleotide biosynthesis protein n=1 Tax=[Clostridium] ultunense Esp TaxID=1288971 RepID=M1ZFP8_9FIRM|nr:molybdopterin-guanine dinucleotide biosynthesis protein B [Schnuerera ultunensis]CCQ97561.1 Molybdopterin-guanine dinucleotide biosynthesis protein [[Clostridium] ultunense Esp]SHD77465.1 Molybdopterin-guanine dinucleotide biosynthesis protein [[Clostridium] ultunense Esp]
MKVFSVVGITESGKTTTIENIIKELRKRKYSVGSVKEIHFEQFAIDTEGSNTYRHKEAGSQLVTARGYYETDILFQERLSMDEILKFYNHDFVILEGVTDANVPKIITAHNEKEILERLDDMVFAISGKLSNTLEEFEGLPVINAMDNAERLVDLIEEKVFDKLSVKSKVKLQIDGKDIDMVPFVQNILFNAVLGVVKELEGYEKGKEIVVRIL